MAFRDVRTELRGIYPNFLRARDFPAAVKGKDREKGKIGSKVRDQGRKFLQTTLKNTDNWSPLGESRRQSGRGKKKRLVKKRGKSQKNKKHREKGQKKKKNRQQKSERDATLQCKQVGVQKGRETTKLKNKNCQGWEPAGKQDSRLGRGERKGAQKNQKKKRRLGPRRKATNTIGQEKNIGANKSSSTMRKELN